MNELARLVPFVFDRQKCRITDKNGNLWFAAKDVCAILGIKRIGHALDDFPPDEKTYIVCEVLSKHLTSAKPHARKTQKLLIINMDGLMRLIGKSRKPQAQPFKDRINKLAADFINQGLRRACLPRPYVYRGKELTWTEYCNQKCDAYLKRHPDATYEDFIWSFSV